MAYYTYPPPEAYNLNKLLYDLKREADLRKRYLENPDAVIAERKLTPDQAEALKSLDQERLAAVGAHRLLVFLAQFRIQMDQERHRFTMQK